LSLIAMPLAVAAVSDISGVPQDQLANFVATLNNANVPPTQVVEVLRYVPVALVYDTTQPQPVFVEYVQTQVQQGITGPALVPVIVERLRTYDIQPQIVTVTAPAQPVTPPRTIIVDHTYIPSVVVTRVEEIRKGHPHGGPPGQLKKIEGVQTGAQIVHKPAPAVVVVQNAGKHEGHIPPGQAKKAAPPPPMISAAPPPQPQAKPLPPGQAKKMEQGGKGHGHDKKH